MSLCEHPLRRRAFVAAGLGCLAGPLLAADEVEAILRRGRAAIVLRHAHAPGTFDPPGFRLGDCSTQRNLDGQGRAQARRIGQWFAGRSLRPARVLSSPWCRCMETAQLAFGLAEAWSPLGSPVGATPGTQEASRRALGQELERLSREPGGFQAWVTHMFVIADLTGQDSASGEGLVLQAAAGGVPSVLGRLRIE